MAYGIIQILKVQIQMVQIIQIWIISSTVQFYIGETGNIVQIFYNMDHILMDHKSWIWKLPWLEMSLLIEIMSYSLFQSGSDHPFIHF